MVIHHPLQFPIPNSDNSLSFLNLPSMASRLILKNAKAPIHFLLRSPASSKSIQNLLVPFPRQSAVEFSKSGIVSELAFIDRPLLSFTDLNSTSVEGGFRVEVRDKRQPVLDDDELTDSESDFEDLDGGFCSDEGEEFGGDDYDNDDAEPRD